MKIYLAAVFLISVLFSCTTVTPGNPGADIPAVVYKPEQMEKPEPVPKPEIAEKPGLPLDIMGQGKTKCGSCRRA